MTKSWRSLLAGVVLASLLLPLAFARPAYAAQCAGDKRVIGDNYTLGTEEVLDSNLVILGGNANLEEGATVNCAVVVIGGNVDIAGTVAGDVVVFGGTTQLRSTAQVGGELVTFGGTTSREEGAVVTGGESQGFSVDDNRGRGWPFSGRVPLLQPVFDFYQSVAQTFLMALGLGLLALLIVLFMPEQTARVAAAATLSPGASGGLGLLTLVAVPVLLVLLTVTICLIPVAFVGTVLFAAALVFGWIALGQVVGARLSTALRLHDVSAAVSAGLGTGLLTLVMSIIRLVPCVGWLPPVVLAALGLGAVTLTRFGTRPYFPSPPSYPLPPAVPPPPAVSPPPDPGELSPAA